MRCKTKISQIILGSTLFFLFIFSCKTQKNNSDKYHIAVKYIGTDEGLVSDLYLNKRGYNLKNKKTVYSDIKVQPEVINSLYQNFSKEIKSSYPTAQLDFNELVPIVIDSMMTRYSTNQDGHIKIFFSEPIDSFLTAEVFYQKRIYKNQSLNNFKGISGSNIGLQYLFLFNKGNKIDTVFKKTQSYH